MKINIQAPWEVNDYTRGVIDEKIGKLTSYNDRILHADVFLKKGDNVGQDDKIIEVRLRLPGPEMFAQASSDTVERAVASVADKLRRQLVKQKEKLSKR